MILIRPIGNTYTGNTSTGNTFLSNYANGATYLYVVNTGATANITISNAYANGVLNANYAFLPVLGNSTIILNKAASDAVYGPATMLFTPVSGGAAF